MDKEKLEYFRSILINKLSELLKEAEKTLGEIGIERVDLIPDLSDRATVESQRSFLLRVRDRERKLILKIQEALRKIDEGTFGICERCGGEISEERLLARPVATLCIECKKRQEEEEKLKEKRYR